MARLKSPTRITQSATLRALSCIRFRGSGVAFISDVNGGSQEGVSLVQSTTYKGKRCSAARAFIDPIRADRRLTLKCNTVATRVLFDGHRVVSIEYIEEKGRSVEKACANNDVVLTAGAYTSPKLLMLSGIGPAEHLAKLGIEVRLNLPGVGQNMQDHHSVSLIARTNGAYGYFGEDRGPRMIKTACNTYYLGQDRWPLPRRR